MQKYINSKGSIWRKWDLHIHAPGTALNDNFKGDWDRYLKALENLEDISVLGITDYYGIDGYNKVKTAKKEGRLKNIDLIIPNIEMRLDIYSKEGRPINYHVLFSPDVDEYIETHFLSELTFEYDGRKYKCTRKDIIELGEQFVDKELSNEKKFEVGIKQFKVSVNDINRILTEENRKIFKGNYLIAVPNKGTDGASGIKVAQFRGIKENIYRTADLIFSSNPNDRNFFSHNCDAVIDLCGKTMPCIHGSDAHSIDKIGRPDLERFTWIKADPTFEGLKQIVYEPINRVRIQPEHPDKKTDYNIIDKVKFTDEDGEFMTETIHLNPDLNVIIGGKSSGKSALLYKIAQSISADEIKKVTQSGNWDNKYQGTFIDNANFEVIFRNGDKYTKDNHSGRIKYIPQMYINKISEDLEGGVLQNKIANILKKHVINEGLFNDLNNSIEQIIFQIRAQVDLLLNQIYVVEEINEEFKKLPEEKVVMKEVNELQEKIQMELKVAELTEDENAIYGNITKHINKKQNEFNIIKKELENIEENKQEVSKKLENTITNLRKIDFKDERICRMYSKMLIEIEKHKNLFLKELEDILKDYETNQVNMIKKMNQLKEERKPIEEKLTRSKLIQELRVKLDEQIKTLQRIDEINNKLEIEVGKQKEIEDRIFSLKEKHILKLTHMVELINETEISDGLQANAQIKFNNEKFDNKFLNSFIRRGKVNNILENPENKTIINNNDIFLFNKDSYISDLKHLYSTILKKSYDDLRLKSQILKKDLFEQLLKGDFLSIHYDLIKENDSLYQMSPGNRGLVLLELLLNLSEDVYPILIDQPEDNLDNRTISNELVKIIRKQKVKRQIIMVTHNANLAILTDAENIIVANQDKSLIYNHKKRFEYLTGSLENTFQFNDGEEKFTHKGVKEHASEILEGGEYAFRVREKRYGFAE